VLADSVLAVTPGHATRVMRERAAQLKDSDPARCLSLTTTLRTLDLECVSEQERDLWMLTFAFLVDYTQKKKAAGIKKQQRQSQDKQADRGVAPAVQLAASAAATTGTGSLPGFELDGVAHGDLSLVHALQLLCDRSIGRAHAQNQSQMQEQTTNTDAAAEGAQTNEGAHAVAESQLRSSVTDARSLLQSPLVVEGDERANATPPVHAASPPHATAALHSKDQMDSSKADSLPLRSDDQQQLQQQRLARQTHENDATLRVDATVAPVAAVPSAIVVPGSEDKAQQPSLQQQQQQQESCSFALSPPQLPAPPNSHHEHGAVAAADTVACADLDARAIGAAPLPSVPSAESLLIAARDRASRELESAREDNRSLYIHSARKMIQLQQKIDALTRENIDLIRVITTQHTYA
jgi:hypothetical protein